MKYFVEFYGMNDPSASISGTTSGGNIDNTCKYVEANGSICVPIISVYPDPSGAAGNHTQFLIDTMAYLDSVHRPYIKGFDALDTNPWNNLLDSYNSTNFDGAGVHPTTDGGQPLIADYIWQHYFKDGIYGQWNWSFGDGNVSGLQNPSHTYTTPGAYDVSLTTCGAATVTADFSANATHGNTPMAVDFTDASTFGAGSNECNTKTRTQYIDAGMPPASITGLHNTTVTNSSIMWAWTNPADTDFNTTDVWKNNVFYYNYTNSTSGVQWNYLTPGTAYTFSARTHDLNGNINSTWVNATASTDPALPPSPTPTPTTTTGAGTTSTNGKAAIVAALSIVGILLIGGGAWMIISMFRGSGLMGRGGSAAAGQSNTAATLTLGTMAIATGALLLLVSYTILGPMFAMV
jgi:PKD repeat protein